MKTLRELEVGVSISLPLVRTPPNGPSVISASVSRQSSMQLKSARVFWLGLLREVPIYYLA
jgi:hypothetical protein